MARKARCYHCERPATLLCDFVIGEEPGERVWKPGSPGSPAQGWYTVSSADCRAFTCDRPLCEKCAHHGGTIFYSGADGGIETRDYCREHANARAARWFMSAEMAALVRKGLLAKPPQDDGPIDADVDSLPPIGETCKACDQPIVRERTAVQLRKAGYEPFWCCGWDCVAKIAKMEGGKT